MTNLPVAGLPEGSADPEVDRSPGPPSPHGGRKRVSA